MPTVAKGVKTSELWILVALLGKSLGVGGLLTPEQVTNTASDVVKVAGQLRDAGLSDEGIYWLAGLYIATRGLIKLFEIVYLKKGEQDGAA